MRDPCSWPRRAALLVALAVGASAAACGDGGRDAGPIVEREALGRRPACPAPASCVGGYRAFLERAAPFARPTSREAVVAAVRAAHRGETPLAPESLPAAELATALVNALNLEPLLAGLEDRALVVTTIARRTTPAFEERHLLLEDPYVGEVEALYLVPHGTGPHPGLVALHGHGDSAAVFRDAYGGGDYPAHGYAVLALTLRVMDIDQDELEMSLALLEEGHALIGLRAYEASLALRYLASRPEVAPDRLALIGHSGGSSTGNLVVRIEPRVRAYVSDHDVDYARLSLFERPHCETVPALHPYHALVNDLDTAEAPVLDVPYGYPFGLRGILRFLDGALG